MASNASIKRRHSPKTRRSIPEIASVLLILGVALAYSPYVRSYGLPTGSKIWSSGFEGGDFSEWTGDINQVGGAVAAVSSTVAYSGTHSGYFYYHGSTLSDHADGYPYEYWSSNRPSRFLVQMWVYVPSVENGITVQFPSSSWISFLSIWVNQGYWSTADPITVDGMTSGVGLKQITMNIYPLASAGYDFSVYHRTQQSPINWPLDQWFEIGIECDLHPGSTSAITVYQNGASILSWTGNLGNTGSSGNTVTYDGLSAVHPGLYIGPGMATFAVYNDNVEVDDLTSGSATTSSTSSTPATTSTTSSTGTTTITSPTTSTSTVTSTSSTQAIGSASSSGWGGYVYAWSFLADESGTVTRVGMDVTSTYSGNLMTGLYADNSGSPGSLLSSSSSTAVVPGWNDLALGTPVQIIAGTRYWMAVQFSNGTSSMRWYYDNSGSGVEVSKTYGSLPNPFGSASAISILGNMRITYMATYSTSTSSTSGSATTSSTSSTPATTSTTSSTGTTTITSPTTSTSTVTSNSSTSSVQVGITTAGGVVAPPSTSTTSSSQATTRSSSTSRQSATSTTTTTKTTTTSRTSNNTTSAGAYSIAATVNVRMAGTVTVYVLQGGRVIASQTYTTNGSHTFTLKGLAAGTYTVVVQANMRMQQIKIVTVPPNAQVTFTF